MITSLRLNFKQTANSTGFTRRQRWLLIGLTLLAFIARLHRLDTQSLWFDETLSAVFASQPLKVAIQSMLEEGLHHSPLFYILLRPFAAGGFSEFSLRFLPAVGGVLAVPLLAQMGRTVANRRVGLWAALLLALNPFHVWYSQEARMYTLLILAALGAMFFFYRNLRRPRWANWLFMAGFTAVGVNSHHFAFFIPLVQFLFIVVTLRQSYPMLRPWVAAQLLVALSLIPWVLTVLDWGHFYLSSASTRPPVLGDLFLTFWNFNLGYTEQVTPVVALVLAVLLALLILGVKLTYRRPGGLLLLLWFFIPPLFTFLASFRLPTYLDRYISLSLPPMLLLIAIGLGAIRRRVWRLAVLGLTLSAMLTGLYRVYYDTTIYNRADWRQVGVYLQQHAASTDIIAPWYQQYMAPFYFYYSGNASFKPIISLKVVNLPKLPDAQNVSGKVWVIIAHPNNSAHLVGHCQPFDMRQLDTMAAAAAWRDKVLPRLIQVKEFTCVRIEVYE